MFRPTRLMLVALAPLVSVVLAAQQAMPAASTAAKSTPMTAQQKIANAMSAGPKSISSHATIMDWGPNMMAPPTQLRAGTNGWVCFPNSPEESAGALGNDPMCLDQQWQTWFKAMQAQQTPKLTATGVAYMLQGDRGVSNSDPMATAPTATNNWVKTPAHVMLAFADPQALDAYPTDPMNGGPWVMWKGTPYAHLMVPVSVTQTAMASAAKPAAKPMAKPAPKPAAK